MARSASSVADVRSSLVRLLVVMVVAGSVLLGVLIWIVVGRALRPVDEMRQTVSAISERDLHRRIDTPGTGDELDRLADTLNDLLAGSTCAVRPRAAVRRRRQPRAAHPDRRRARRCSRRSRPIRPRWSQVRAEALARLSQLQDLVEELLDARQGRRRHVGTAPARPVDLDELVLGQARQLGAHDEPAHRHLARSRADRCAGRDTDLGRVVENLATNAARHARTTVAFSVRQVDGVVEFTVSDDGPGIAAADRARIFERFRTLEDARVAGPRRRRARPVDRVGDRRRAPWLDPRRRRTRRRREVRRPPAGGTDAPRRSAPPDVPG